MRHQLVALLSVLLLACQCCGAQAGFWDRFVDSLPWTKKPEVSCPPAGFDSLPGFSLETYISAPWYVAAQVPLIYQQKNSLYCVKAIYRPIDTEDPGAGVYVFNYANKDHVNGPSMGTGDDTSSDLVALPADQSDSPTAASKLQVGPKALSEGPLKFLRGPVFGPYWVVAAKSSEVTDTVETEPDADTTTTTTTTTTRTVYDWVVVSGGSPSQRSGGACTTFGPDWLPTTVQYKGGLWLFTRRPNDATAKAEALAAAKALGFNVVQLVDVEHEGCNYEGSRDS